jgi:hypothetical protein
MDNTKGERGPAREAALEDKPIRSFRPLFPIFYYG